MLTRSYSFSLSKSRKSRNGVFSWKHSLNLIVTFRPAPTKPLAGIDNISVNANALVEDASMKNDDEEDKNKIVDDPRPSNNNNNENAEIPMEQWTRRCFWLFIIYWLLTHFTL